MRFLKLKVTVWAGQEAKNEHQKVVRDQGDGLTRLGYCSVLIVSKNCSDLSRKKNCSVLGSIWPSAQSFDPRGSRTACEACQNAKRMRHGVHFFS